MKKYEESAKRTNPATWVFECRDDVCSRVSNRVTWDRSVSPQHRPVCDVISGRGWIGFDEEHVQALVREILEVEICVHAIK